MKAYYKLVTTYPKLIIVILLLITVMMVSQLNKLEWETDARVYMPKGHPAIEYDEKIERIFGAKDAIIVMVVNDEKGVLNPITLEKINRITDKISALPGVIAARKLDVASLSTATLFEGDEQALGAARLMAQLPTDQAAIDAIEQKIAQHKDILIGNLISADAKAAMIRAKVKEGAVYRYQTYWQIKGIIAAETGGSQAWGGWGDNQQWSAGEWGEDTASTSADGAESGKQQGWQQWQDTAQEPRDDNGDTFHIAGRPAIEVTSGLHAMQDMKVMVPLLIAVMSIALFMVFKTGRGVILPLCVMAGAIVWTMGTMAMLGVPMYTISTMLPVILVAVGIGDSIHFLSSYYNKVLEDPYRKSPQIVSEVLQGLSGPLITTSLTTAIGFMALLFAEMPPFKIFGLFTVLGILYSWLLSVTFIGAMLSIMKPKVAGYLERKRSLRIHDGQDALTRGLVKMGAALVANPRRYVVMGMVILLVIGAGASRLYVNSSWMSDFRDDSEVAQATKLLNSRFDGALTLNVVVEAAQQDALKSPQLLHKIEGLQQFAEGLPMVGDSLSIVDYLKSLNKTLHSMDEAYYTIPATQEEIAEGLFLYSVSGQPELLDEMVDYDYQNANIVVMLKTDETMLLRETIDAIDAYVKQHFGDTNVKINFAGSGNNSYVWADLLIDSQTASLLFSKLAILLLALLLLRSFIGGIAVVLPVAVTTLIVAGLAGWLGIPMDVSTALAAGIAIGVGVDYAVHFVFRYRDNRNAGQDHEAAIANTMKGVGRTIVFNAVVVSAGFSVLLLSQFPPHAKLGAFIVLYMVLSCLVAIYVLPLLLKRYKAG